MRNCLPSDAQNRTLGDSRNRLIFILNIANEKLMYEFKKKIYEYLPR